MRREEKRGTMRKERGGVDVRKREKIRGSHKRVVGEMRRGKGRKGEKKE